ncbi:ribosome hibernation-promoting factor, HPF/YfiA family [Mumia zhuanghuii]|uniref:Ribosome hibernation promoting factor n=1 Tax=Mumia zhuanghuii TaxID=2585211 RepID=A0A5C4MN67_9ACTN|nr:ribosome-associated translation inhibitor RaiA [Mumia zhuanghuii]TNC31237.1 ribosome-associated translation inhibitor RaiA [Mumia zhuanghuii]TNC44902.1 ribosome-associated translation inhibitor RaiA [Mumia zhuanghuii]
MDVVVKGRNCEISQRFRDYVDEKVPRIEKYDQRKKIQRVEVELTKEYNPRQSGRCERVEITLRGRGPAMRAEACSDDPLAALDKAVDKLEAQVRKAQDRRRVHHGARKPMSVSEFAASNDETATESDEEPIDAVRYAGPLEVRGEGPLVVREKTHRAAPMTLDQALYEMEMVGHDFYLFVEKDSGHPSVVYRRRGYDYGVIHIEQSAGGLDGLGDNVG